MNFRTDINGLRAVAVLLVVLFHLRTPLFGGGFIGVDIFFVISGFLMTRIIFGRLDKAAFSLLQFYYDRAVRIIPALAVLVLSVLAFGLVFVDPEALATMAKHGVSALLFLSNVQFWTESGYFDRSAETKWFLHTWSLSVEWQFYLVYPVVLLVASRFIRAVRARYIFLAIGLVLSLGLSIVTGLHWSGRANSFGFFMLPTRAWEMIAGGLVAVNPDLLSRLRDRTRAWLQTLGLAGIFLGLALFTQTSPWPAYGAVLPVASTALVLLAQSPRSLLGLKPMQWIGSSSYSIYLWHWPLCVALAYFDLQQPVAKVGAFVLALGLGWASYRMIEQNSHRLLKAASLRGGAASIALGGAVLIAGCFAVNQSLGFPSRVAGDRALYEDASKADGDRAFPSGRCGGLSPVTGAVKPCSVGTPSARGDVIVLGDSFAEMWFARAQALQPQLTDHAVVFVTKNGCPPVHGVERTAPGFNCAAFNKAAFAEALSPRYKTVVIASMWTSHFRSDQNVVNVDRDTALRRLGEDVHRLRAAGKTVVVVTTSPYPGEEITERIKVLAFQGRPVDAHWSFDFGKVSALAPGVDSGLRRLNEPGVTVLDPSAILCADAICPLMENGKPIYSDAGHLRSSFTARRGDFLDPAFLGRL